MYFKRKNSKPVSPAIFIVNLILSVLTIVFKQSKKKETEVVPCSHNTKISSLNLFQTLRLRWNLLARESYLVMTMSAQEQDIGPCAVPSVCRKHWWLNLEVSHVRHISKASTIYCVLSTSKLLSVKASLTLS